MLHLQDSYEGFIGDKFIDDFLYYATVLFDNFGDRIKDWMTFNEPWVTCVLQVVTCYNVLDITCYIVLCNMLHLGSYTEVI